MHDRTNNVPCSAFMHTGILKDEGYDNVGCRMGCLSSGKTSRNKSRIIIFSSYVQLSLFSFPCCFLSFLPDSFYVCLFLCLCIIFFTRNTHIFHPFLPFCLPLYLPTSLFLSLNFPSFFFILFLSHNLSSTVKT